MTIWVGNFLKDDVTRNTNWKAVSVTRCGNCSSFGH